MFNVYDHTTPVNILWDEFKILCKSGKCQVLVINHLGFLITSTLSRKKQCKYNNARRTNFGQHIVILKKKFKDFVVPATTIIYHHFLHNHNKCTKRSGNISKV